MKHLTWIEARKEKIIENKAKSILWRTQASSWIRQRTFIFYVRSKIWWGGCAAVGKWSVMWWCDATQGSFSHVQKCFIPLISHVQERRIIFINDCSHFENVERPRCESAPVSGKHAHGTPLVLMEGWMIIHISSLNKTQYVLDYVDCPPHSSLWGNCYSETRAYQNEGITIQ